MAPEKGDLSERGLVRGLSGVGVSITSLRRSAREIVLFGSRAAGVAGPLSDWDLLCIGCPSREQRWPSSTATLAAHSSVRPPFLFSELAADPRVRRTHLVWIDERSLGTQKWLESELAGHVARYGVWLHGKPRWVSSVRCGPAAAERFVVAFERTLRTVRGHPKICRLRLTGWRQAPIRGSSYALFYREGPTFWFVGAILSTLQDPDVIQARLLIREIGEQELGGE